MLEWDLDGGRFAGGVGVEFIDLGAVISRLRECFPAV
jgi:hypothetical protein